MICCIKWESDTRDKAAGKSRRETDQKSAETVAQTGRKFDPEYEAMKAKLAQLWKECALAGMPEFTVVAESIEANFMHSLRRITAQDMAYVMDARGDRAIRWFSNSLPAWASPLGPQLRLLLKMLRDVVAGEFRAPWKTMAAITLALLDIGNPMNYLPDSLPGIGHIDDALVVALCVSVVRKDLQRYATAKNIDLADYGF
ncbi:DUF1232 domain-containing protein [candidate division KSB1 bacterium]|nr:MAG: DUF1232 domain-containing protein [candidate division KSB1 bacterium]